MYKSGLRLVLGKLYAGCTLKHPHSCAGCVAKGIYSVCVGLDNSEEYPACFELELIWVKAGSTVKRIRKPLKVRGIKVKI